MVVEEEKEEEEEEEDLRAVIGRSRHRRLVQGTDRRLILCAPPYTYSEGVVGVKRT